jgi:hypothetical protein
LGYVGGRAIDALDLINKSTFPAADAVKIAQCQQWLENVAKDVARQVEETKEQIAALTPPVLEAIPADKAPEAVAETASDALPISEAADTLK